ncbi:MAG TPA: hypothetical protein VEA38_22110 [Terriglobales bacterium]|nr:hypothetical protein [Terriglobales bacterium]
MKNVTAGFIAVLTLASGSPALAQSPGIFGEIGGILSDALTGRHAAEPQTWRGYFVEAKGPTMIVRADDGKTYAVDMTAVHGPAWSTFTLGQPVTLAAKPGSTPQTLIAARLDVEQADGSGRVRDARAYRTVQGAVERVDGSRLTVRTDEAGVLTVDVAQLSGEAEFRARDGARIVLEPGAANTVVWIEREDRARRPGILRGLGDEYRRLHGHRLHGSASTLVVLADDGRASVVDMSAVVASEWQAVELGQAVSLAIKPGRDANTFIAGRIQPDPVERLTGRVPKRSLLRVEGTVEAVQGSQLKFKKADGVVMRADASRLPGDAAGHLHERGVLIYEIGPRQEAVALWLERAALAAPAVAAAKGTGEYQRIRGFVQSVGAATIAFKADDGRTLAVDTAAVDTTVRNTLRAGDLVSILGKSTARAEHFVAEFIEREARR